MKKRGRSPDVKPGFFTDENMPRTLAPVLRRMGYAAEDVRDVGLAGQPDSVVFAYAQSTHAVLITSDKDFANILQYPLGSHAGIIVLRVPDRLPVLEVNQVVQDAVNALDTIDLTGSLVIVRLHGMRIRRPAVP
jgi:predicted nuclease of predicted toxin-antitoxin system